MHLAVRSMLSVAPGYALAAAASSVAEAEQLIMRAQPDLLLSDVDIAGESGIGLCRWTRQTSPATAAVILTSRDEPLLVQSAIAAGVSGYLLKASPPESLMANLRWVAEGKQVLDQRLGRVRHEQRETAAAAELGLSRREQEVLTEMLAGLGNLAIARRLCISEDTVKSHVKAVFRKLGARDRAHALALALGTAATLPPSATAARSGRPAQPATAGPVEYAAPRPGWPPLPRPRAARA